jgi:hypothetical protein
VEVQAWAADQHVFVSSVMGGMTAEREAAVQAITAVGAQPVWFESFGGMDDDPEDAYSAQVGLSDIYLGILGARYGRPLKSGYSATHGEYNEAVARGLRISVWTTSADQDGRQRDFLDEVRVFHTTGTYTSPDDLARGIGKRLQAMAAEALAPWVKVGNTVFRAASVHDDGRAITVVGRVRDNAVVASLEGRRPDIVLREEFRHTDHLAGRYQPGPRQDRGVRNDERPGAQDQPHRRPYARQQVEPAGNDGEQQDPGGAHGARRPGRAPWRAESP